MAHLALEYRQRRRLSLIFAIRLHIIGLGLLARNCNECCDATHSKKANQSSNEPEFFRPCRDLAVI